MRWRKKKPPTESRDQVVERAITAIEESLETLRALRESMVELRNLKPEDKPRPT